MKTNLKTTTGSLFVALTLIIGCHKDSTTQPSPTTTTQTTNTDNYSSMANFFAKNGVVAQTYTITNSAGGSFTTPQGTVVTIPANTFVNNLNQQIAGTVTITFKDIYKKSDMLLSNITTNMTTGAPLKSGGEFFIKATSAGTAVNMANTITVKQPLNSLPVDSLMQPYIKTDSTSTPVNIDTLGWALAHYNATVSSTVNGYIYSLYTIGNPNASGAWCNSDDPYYFSSYTQGSLILQETDNASDYNTYVYLIFKGITTVDACHTYNGNTFSYSNCVPIGLQCTVVAVGVKNGTVYSSFTPITIGANQTVNFSMSATTTAQFKAALTALN